MKTKLALQIFLFLLLSCSGIQQAFAVILHDLYTITLQVPDNSIETRNKNLPLAFNNLLLRVTGSSDVLCDSEYIKAGEHLERFISSYAYNKDETAYTLKLNFNEQLLNNLLFKTGRVGLGKNRQHLLLWVALEQNNKWQVITTNNDNQLFNKIDLLAKERGLPIILPLFDLTERVKINEQDIVNFNTTILQQAAKRYDSPIMLIGKINNADNVWHCEWRLQNKQHATDWQNAGDDLEDVLRQTLNRVSDELVAQHKQLLAKNFAPNMVTLRVNGINSAISYAKILTYLKELQGVQRVEVGQVDGTQAVFTVVADGGKDFVQRSLLIDNILVVDNKNLEATPDLIYRINL